MFTISNAAKRNTIKDLHYQSLKVTDRSDLPLSDNVAQLDPGAVDLVVAGRGRVVALLLLHDLSVVLKTMQC